MKHLWPLSLLFSIICVGCSEGAVNPPVLLRNADHGVFICNEGNFTYGNATLSFYDAQADYITEPIPFVYNGVMFPLGDVCQSMYIRDDRGFIVVNNSSKIYVIDIHTNAYLGKIAGLPSPRHIEFISDTKAYVSDLVSPSMTIINPATLQITGHLRVGRSTEQTVRYGDVVFACNWSYGNKLYKIDSRTDEVVDSLQVTLQPNSMVLDKNGKLWVLSDGGYPGSPGGQQIPALTRIDATTFQLEATFPFTELDAAPAELTIDGSGSRLYFLNSGTTSQRDGVWRIGVSDAVLPAGPFIAEGAGQLFYALGIDPLTEEIYVSDAIDYAQRGIIFRYSSAGTLLKQFKAGLIPGAFCFKVP